MLIANDLVMKFKPSLWWRTITKYIVILTRLFQNSIVLISCFSECRFYIDIVLMNVFIQILHSSFKGRFLQLHTNTHRLDNIGLYCGVSFIYVYANSYFGEGNYWYARIIFGITGMSMVRLKMSAWVRP